MTTWAGSIGASAAVAAVAAAARAVVWRRTTRRSVERILEAARPRASEVPAGRTPVPADLPAPVARYFAFALPPAPRPIRSARVHWTGEFQLRPGGGWRPFEAAQHFTARPPGFVWDARIHVMPLVTVSVRDGYAAERGTMLGRAGALITVVDRGGTPEMAASALARWLGEAVWFPTALLPGPRHGEGVRWEAVDDSTARATITDGGTTASAEFHFAPTGEITRMTAMRFRDVNGTSVPTPFEGRYRGYAWRDGVRIPMAAEVAWLLPEGRFAYWRGRAGHVAYDREAAPDATPGP